MRLFILCLLCLCLPLSALAHPGGTDGKGGHYDRETGTYHYHHGHPAHQHPNGVCPYESKNQAQKRTDPYTETFLSRLKPLYVPTPRPTPKPTPRPTQRPTDNPAEDTAPDALPLLASAAGGSAAFAAVRCIAKARLKE